MQPHNVTPTTTVLVASSVRVSKAYAQKSTLER